MIVVWRGWGILTIPLVLLTVFAMLMGTFWITETFHFPDWTKTLDFAATFIVAGALNWMVGRYFNNKGKARIIHDEKTGRPLTKVEARHELFFIKMEYWSIPLFLAAAVFAASSFYAH